MSALESSVTLEDVFSVVEAKRVPLAPELAGYLTLEIADGADAGGGDVEAKTVFVSEEGTVALVRPKKDVILGEAESSVRAILAKLLEASGSGTPALSAAAKRKAGNGLPALVEELEAALIPVNRAAGRRALARLAREVKRVMLGIGRNATVPPIASRPPPSRPVPAPSFTDEAATAKKSNQLSEMASQLKAPEILPMPSEPESPKAPSPGRLSAAPPLPPPGLTPPPVPRAAPRTVAPVPPPPAPVRTTTGNHPPPPVPPPRREPVSGSAPVAATKGTENKLFGGDEVDSLLDAFEISSASERQVSRDLKAIAGLDPSVTPPPATDARTLAELTKDIGKDLPKALDDGGVDALLALADASVPLAPPLPPPGFGQGPPSPVATGSAAAVATAGLALAPTSEAPVPVSAVRVPAAEPPPMRRPTPSEPLSPPKKITVPAATDAISGKREKPRDFETRPQGPSAKRSRGGTRPPRAPRTGFAMLVFALVVLGAGTAAIWTFAPWVFTGKKKPIVPPVASSVQPAPIVPKCKVALLLTDVPANAEILLRMGQAPVDVERMPVGTRLELVATAEGYAPRRAVIKAEAPWDKGSDGKPRIEVPIQLDPSKARPNTVDPWPAAEAGSQVGGSGPPGTVHVVSNVRGAEVWLLAGLGPEARIDQLRCDSDIDVLLAGPSALRKRLHVAEKDIDAVPVDPTGNKVVSVSAK